MDLHVPAFGIWFLFGYQMFRKFLTAVDVADWTVIS